MHYQWGRKDPFTFATSSEKGGNGLYDYGKYPVKIYTIDGVLIYQENDGSSNKDKQPVGGLIHSSTLATSMMEVTKNPIIFYGESYSAVINQEGHTKSLWDYYWTSYSRGLDGIRVNLGGNPLWHNSYLNGYVSQRFKSIYDPCPYGFRVASNGTFNSILSILKWTMVSYTGGIIWNNKSTSTWFLGLGDQRSGYFREVGNWGFYSSSIPSSASTMYAFLFQYSNSIVHNRYDWPRSSAISVRCIELTNLTLCLIITLKNDTFCLMLKLILSALCVIVITYAFSFCVYS